jgi:hypothetical protein
MAGAALKCEEPVWWEEVSAVDYAERSEAVTRLFISFGGVATVAADGPDDFLPSRAAEQEVLDLLDAPPKSR